MNDTLSTGWLDKILTTGASIFGTVNTNDANAKVAAQNAKAQQAAAQAQATQSNSLVKIAVIGGGILAVIVVVAILFKRK